MHRVVATDGTHRQSGFLKWVRTAAYALMCLAGVLLVVSDLVGLVYGTLGEVMAWFLIFGGLLSAIGAATAFWFGEFTGLPLLAPAFGVFGALVWRSSNDFAPWIAAANLALLMSICLVMIGRWWVVYAIYRLAVALGKDKGRE